MEVTVEKKPARGGAGVVRVSLDALVALAPRLAALSGDEGYSLDVEGEAKKARELLAFFFRYAGISHEIPAWPPSDADLKCAATVAVRSGKLYWMEALDVLERLDLPADLAGPLRERPLGSSL